MPEWLPQRARLTPDRLALLTEDDSLSFAQLDAAVRHASEWLSSSGVSEKNHVAVLLPNNLFHVVVVHALIRLGAVLIPINTRLSSSEIDARVHASEALFLITDSHFGHLSNQVGDAGVRVLTAGYDLTSCSSPLVPRSSSLGETHFLDLDSLHSIFFTSGTTGEPRGAMLTYGNHWWNAVGSVLNLGLESNDRWLACLPFFHVGGLSILFRSVIYGIPAVIKESFDADKVSRSIDDDDITIISLVPTTLQRLLDHRGSHPFPQALRCVLLGGAQAPRALLERCIRDLVPVCQTYGLTETASQVATLAATDAPTRIGSSGKPLFPMELRIESDGKGGEVGRIGEIVVRGPTVTRGYFRDPQATKNVLRDGWLHTGDVGYIDEEGYLYVVARRQDLIVTGGENVYPAEVENVLVAHPFVQDAAVVGVPDPHWGQSVSAVVVLLPGRIVAEEDLRDFCRARLGAFKIPRTISFRPALPRNSTGKLLRHRLNP